MTYCADNCLILCGIALHFLHEGSLQAGTKVTLDMHLDLYPIKGQIKLKESQYGYFTKKIFFVGVIVLFFPFFY